MQIIYEKEQDILGIAFLPERIRQGENREGSRTRQVKLGRGIRAWVSEDGETLYSIEIDGQASERAELDSIRLVTCDLEGSEEQTVSFPER